MDTLKGKGPFTVFAPTDEAFAKLPAGTVEDLLKPENKEKLVAILTYHVVPGRDLASQVVKMTSAKTVNGQSLAISVNDGTVMVDKPSLSFEVRDICWGHANLVSQLAERPFASQPIAADHVTESSHNLDLWHHKHALSTTTYAFIVTTISTSIDTLYCVM